MGPCLSLNPIIGLEHACYLSDWLGHKRGRLVPIPPSHVYHHSSRDNVGKTRIIGRRVCRLLIDDDEGRVSSATLAPSSTIQTNGSVTESTSTTVPSAAVEKVPVDQPLSPPLHQLLMMFIGQLCDAVMAVFSFRASGHDFSAIMDLLLEGPMLSSILSFLNDQFEHQPASRIETYPEDVWQDVVIKHKPPKMDLTNPLHVMLLHQPALDTGGVR